MTEANVTNAADISWTLANFLRLNIMEVLNDAPDDKRHLAAGVFRTRAQLEATQAFEQEGAVTHRINGNEYQPAAVLSEKR